jgi:methylenetetrahydrofolate dehydrogenase (NADP+)/methenyltetrahydrofolate cyclohydrolase
MDGKALAKNIEGLARYEISTKRNFSEKEKPKLIILTDHSDPACEVYMRNKLKAAERCGIEAEVVDVPAGLDGRELSHFMVDIQESADGVILQLPVRDKRVARDIVKRINIRTDVDGQTVGNIANLYEGKVPLHLPCTPAGIMKLLTHYSVPISGKHAVVVGRSTLVGRPMAELLLQSNATVTICHSKTENLSEITRQADILVVATGKANLITADMVKPGAAVIDVGINRVDGKLCGDVDFESVQEVSGWITPVPGGVGPMTVAMLMYNVSQAYW